MKQTKMRKWLTRALIASGMTAAMAPIGPAALSAQQTGPDMPIRLKLMSFDPLRTTPDLTGEPAQLRANAVETPGRTGLYLVQFEGPVRDAWKDDVQRLGAHLYGYIPDYAFIARLDPSALPVLRALDFVRWIGPHAPAYRIAPELSARNAQLQRENTSPTFCVWVLPPVVQHEQQAWTRYLLSARDAAAQQAYLDTQ